MYSTPPDKIMRSTKLFPSPALQKHGGIGIITPWCNESCCAECSLTLYRAVGCWRTSRPAAYMFPSPILTVPQGKSKGPSARKVKISA